jgi:hypothetical protein
MIESPGSPTNETLHPRKANEESRSTAFMRQQMTQAVDLLSVRGYSRSTLAAQMEADLQRNEAVESAKSRLEHTTNSLLHYNHNDRSVIADHRAALNLFANAFEEMHEIHHDYWRFDLNEDTFARALRVLLEAAIADPGCINDRFLVAVGVLGMEVEKMRERKAPLDDGTMENYNVLTIALYKKALKKGFSDRVHITASKMEFTWVCINGC